MALSFLPQQNDDPFAASRLKLAQAMMQSGTQTAPVTSHWEGLGRLAQALGGAYQVNQAKDKWEKDQANDANVSQSMAEAFADPAKSMADILAISKGGSRRLQASTAGSIFEQGVKRREKEADAKIKEQQDQRQFVQNAAMKGFMPVLDAQGKFTGGFEPAKNFAEINARIQKMEQTAKLEADLALKPKIAGATKAAEMPYEVATHIQKGTFDTSQAQPRAAGAAAGAAPYNQQTHDRNNESDARWAGYKAYNQGQGQSPWQNYNHGVQAQQDSQAAMHKPIVVDGQLVMPSQLPGFAPPQQPPPPPPGSPFAQPPQGAFNMGGAANMMMPPGAGGPPPGMPQGAPQSLPQGGPPQPSPVPPGTPAGDLPAMTQPQGMPQPQDAPPAMPPPGMPAEGAVTPPAGVAGEVTPGVYRPPMSRSKIQEVENKYRDDARTDQAVKSYRASLPIYESVQRAAKEDNRQAYLDLVYGIAKILDPESVVREGELVLVRAMGTYGDQLRELYSKAFNGAPLSERTRDGLMKVLDSRMQALGGQYDAAMQGYSEAVKRSGGNPDNVLPKINRKDAPDEATTQKLVAQAKQALASGKSPIAVKQVLRDKGINPVLLGD